MNSTRRKITIESSDSVPDEYGVTIQPEMVRRSVTPAQPARIRVTTTNHRTPKRISISEESCALFNRHKGFSDDPEGLILRTPGPGHENADPPWSFAPRGWPAYACGLREYSSGESVSNEYFVWDVADVEVYFSPDVYRFQAGVRVGGDPGGHDFQWGFQLAVEDVS